MWLRYNLFMNDRKTILPLRLRDESVEMLMTFAEIEKRSPESLVEEALEIYFKEAHRRLAEKNLIDENAQTNLSYEEFWDGVDI